jgi:hypothetical protein
MAELSFYAGENHNINALSGSGLGFYGSAGFGASVLVSEYQANTYITDSNGTIQGAMADNIKFQNSQSGIVQTATSGLNILAIPNYQASLNPRFTHSSAVKVQNVEARIYDRSSINNPASGVTVKIAELIHPTITQIGDGSGDQVWIGVATNPQTGTATVGGSGIKVTLAQSPGISGLMAGNGANSQHASVQHDWYMAISASPDSIGSKLFGLYISLEYL